VTPVPSPVGCGATAAFISADPRTHTTHSRLADQAGHGDLRQPLESKAIGVDQRFNLPRRFDSLVYPIDNERRSF
jgi:hypothetical protein